MPKKKFGQCTYCGRHRKLTVDHLPPKSLFGKPHPPDLLKIPSCGPCNNQASKDDEYFKTVLVLKDRAGDHQDAVAVRPSVLRSLQMAQKARFTGALLKRIAPVSVLSPAGLYLGEHMAFDVDLSRLDRVVARITKGLFYCEKGYPLPPEYEVSVYSESGLRDLTPSEVREIQNTVIAPTLKMQVHSLGRGVMRYWVAWSHTPPVSC